MSQAAPLSSHPRLQLLGEAPAGPQARWPLFRKGFRPFFLLAALHGTGFVSFWLFALSGYLGAGAWLDPFTWHAHEMMFGLIGAVLAGFLLTAVGNWTGRETATGWWLAALCALWLGGRVAPLLPGISPAVVAALDLVFLPALALTLARPIWATRNYRNLIMVVALVLMWGANLVIHLDALDILPMWRRRGLLAGLDLALLFVAIMGGRVIPMFTRNTTGAATANKPWLDKATMALLLGLYAADMAGQPQIAAVVAGIAAVTSAWRATRWGSWSARKEPLLWVLHIGYLWLPVGLAMRSFALTYPAALSESLALHALTLGCLTTVMLGMMARVALGHTGRPLVVPRLMVYGFVLAITGAIARIALPLISLDYYYRSVHIAGGNIAVAWLFYVIAYARILGAPRVDRKPG